MVNYIKKILLLSLLIIII